MEKVYYRGAQTFVKNYLPPPPFRIEIILPLRQNSFFPRNDKETTMPKETNIADQLPKHYVPAEVEPKRLEQWLSDNFVR